MKRRMEILLVISAVLLLSVHAQANPRAKNSKRFGSDLSSCPSKGSIRRGYVAQGNAGNASFFGFNCYEKKDGKDEGGLFYFSKRYHGETEPAPGVFRDPSDCKKANDDYSKYTDRVDRLIQEGKIKSDSLEAHDYAVSFCTGADGKISRISFHRPPKADRIAFENEKKAYQEEQARLKKAAAASDSADAPAARAGDARPK